MKALICGHEGINTNERQSKWIAFYVVSSRADLHPPYTTKPISHSSKCDGPSDLPATVRKSYGKSFRGNTFAIHLERDYGR